MESPRPNNWKFLRMTHLCQEGWNAEGDEHQHHRGHVEVGLVPGHPARRVREARTELRKFIRESKKTNPGASCHLQYDKAYVNRRWVEEEAHTTRCYVWSEERGKVVEFSPVSSSAEC